MEHEIAATFNIRLLAVKYLSNAQSRKPSFHFELVRSSLAHARHIVHDFFSSIATSPHQSTDRMNQRGWRYGPVRASGCRLFPARHPTRVTPGGLRTSLFEHRKSQAESQAAQQATCCEGTPLATGVQGKRGCLEGATSSDTSKRRRLLSVND